MPEPAESRLVIRTRERYAAVADLRRQGESLSAICRVLSLDRKTVQRFARASTVDDLLGKATARHSLLDPFKVYLHQRWNGGVTEAAALAKEIAAQGYTGSEQTVRRYLQQFRGMITAPPAPPTAPKVRPSPAGCCAVRATSIPTSTRNSPVSGPAARTWTVLSRM